MGPRRWARVLRHVGHLLAWWLLLFALWWALVGEWSTSELGWGVGISFLAAVTGALVTGHGFVDGGASTRWVRSAPSIAWAVVVDFAVVVAVLARCMATGQRDTTGSFVRRPAGSGPDDVRTAALRSWLTVATTFSPNSYVVDLDPGTGVVLLHDLQARRSSEEPA